jgi:6-phosphogluconolactonase
MHYQFIPAESEDSFLLNAIEFLNHKIENAIKDHDHCTIGLCGGSTPTQVYEALGTLPLPWGKISFFLLDERYTPKTHPDSNQKMIRETLLKHATIPEENLIFPNTALPIDDCISNYTDQLLELFAEHQPDIAIIGMGDDGHITSLFPPLSGDALNDGVLVLHTTTEKFAVYDRISTSLNTVCSAESRLFLIKGEAKKDVWDMMLASPEDETRWPAKRVIQSGEVAVIWMA